jgi:hypothetical protein
LRAPTLVTLLLLAACSGEPPRPVTDFASPAPSASALRPLSSRDRSEAVAGPADAAAPDPNDPAEPGIGDLPRLARYVFRVMGSHDEVCPFENPYRDRLRFALDLEVKEGRIVRVVLGHVGLGPEEQLQSLGPSQWPRELTGYVACLAPHLEAVVMDPAPTDGAYEPAYSFAGRPGGRAEP